MKLNYLRQTESLDRYCWNNFRAVPFPDNLLRLTFPFSKGDFDFAIFKHFGMMTLPDASPDVGDERQPAARVPCPTRQHPVSSWEAVRELIPATSEPRATSVTGHGSHGIPLPPVPLHQHRRLSSGSAGHGQPGLPALRRWRQVGFSPLAPSCRGIS